MREARFARQPTNIPAAIFIALHIPGHGIGILCTVASAAGKLRCGRPKAASVAQMHESRAAELRADLEPAYFS